MLRSLIISFISSFEKSHNVSILIISPVLIFSTVAKGADGVLLFVIFRTLAIIIEGSIILRATSSPPISIATISSTFMLLQFLSFLKFIYVELLFM